MPRFVKSGPVVPDELVQSLEDNRVVIFCGAGISIGAGLPSYEGLVEHCYNVLGEVPPGKREKAWLWPDRMLGALEGKFGAAQVRKAVYDRLKVMPTNLDMHVAILRLAKLRGQSGLRLVTTNFDTLFEQAQTEWSYGKDLHSGPVLPIPRNDKSLSWRSAVYLHGRLEDQTGNDHLVLTSADFGRSYLTDAWAARFVARLFTDFTVLFIGYSLNDPVLRYMTDAFAAENTASRLTAKRAPAYIFVASSEAAPDDTPYRHRNLRPIFYKYTKNHRYLRATVIEWANAREDYLKSTSQLIARIAPRHPAAISPSDMANLTWAVCGRPGDEGYGAKIFASLKKRPPIQWLDEFERRENDLLAEHSAAATAAQDNGDELPVAPGLFAAPLFPRPEHASSAELQPQSKHLAFWLASHIGEYEFAARVIQKLNERRVLHPYLRDRIRETLTVGGAIKPGLSKLWTLITSTSSSTLIAGRSFPPELRVPAALGTGARTLAFKLDLLDALIPSVALAQPYQASQPAAAATVTGEEDSKRGVRFSEVANARVVIAGGDQMSLLVSDLLDADQSGDFLAELLPELTNLLRRSYDLYELIEQRSEGLEVSVINRPSIVPHAQNRDRGKWAEIVTLIWHGWQHLDTQDAVASLRSIDEWLASDLPVLRRLGLASLNETQSLTARQKTERLFSV